MQEAGKRAACCRNVGVTEMGDSRSVTKRAGRDNDDRGSVGQESRAEGGVGALCSLAATQPASFIENLDWEISGDLSLIEAVETPEDPGFAFRSPVWLGAWIETMGARRGASPVLACARLGKLPVIVVPLCVERRGPFRQASLVAQDVSDYNDPLVHRELAPYLSPALMGALWRKVAALVPDADYLTLRKLPIGPCDPETGKPWRACREETERSHWFAIQGAWQTEADRFFGASTRHSLNRKAKKLARIGEISFRRLDDTKARSAAMAVLIGWKTAHLGDLGAANRFLNRAFVRFLERLAQDGDPGTHRLYAMHVGEEVLAVTYMICCRTRWFLYQTAYTSTEAGRWSPGLFLLRHILQEAHDAGIEVFDFGLGNEGYKDRFCDRQTTLYRAGLPITARGRVAVAAIDSITYLRDAVRIHPALRKPVLFVLQALAAFKSRRG